MLFRSEALPLGNGRMGALWFGGTDVDRIVLNEQTLWSGSPQDANRPDAWKALAEIRRLLFAGQNVEAQALVNAHFVCDGPGSGHAQGANLPFGCYQTLGDLTIRWTGGGAITDYRRQLDLATAGATVSFKRGDMRETREMFASFPDRVIALRFEADRPGALSFRVQLSRRERAVTRAVDERTLLMEGALTDGRGGDGMRLGQQIGDAGADHQDRKSTRLDSSHRT